MRSRVRSLTLLSGLKIWHCRELWCRPATTALIRPLAWEPPYAKGAALEKTKTIITFKAWVIKGPVIPKDSLHPPLHVRIRLYWSSHRGSAVMNPSSIHEDTGSIPGLAQCVKDPVLPCELWCRSQKWLRSGVAAVVA